MVFGALWPKPLNEGEDEWLAEQRAKQMAEKFSKDIDGDNIPDVVDNDIPRMSLWQDSNQNMSSWQDSDVGDSSFVIDSD